MAELEITKIIGRGRGLAHHDGATWMVTGCLPGEKVLADEINHRRGVIEAMTTAVVGPPHPTRDTNPCQHSQICGGCDWAHVLPEGGAELKAMVAAETARSFPALAERLRSAPVKASPPAYRLRSRLHWDPSLARLGFFARGSHEVATISGCQIVSPKLEAARPAIEASLVAGNQTAGELEWLENLDGSSAVIGFTSADPDCSAPLPSREDLTELVDGAHSLTRTGRIVGGGAGWGATSVTMDLPRSLEVPVGCFFQVNRHLVPWLFNRVAELVGPEALPTWDLHGGVGFLAAAALNAAPRELVLVETNGIAAKAAGHNLPEIRVVARTAEAYLRRGEHLPKDALVLTDPPRAGMSSDLRRCLTGWHPKRIFMMACDPATWSRDAAHLLERGYELAHLELVDLFPSTHHVEVLAVLESR